MGSESSKTASTNTPKKSGQNKRHQSTDETANAGKQNNSSSSTLPLASKVMPSSSCNENFLGVGKLLDILF